MNEYQATASTGRGLADEVIYYRKPRRTRDGEPANQAGWITWGDSFSGTKMRDFGVRGFSPLREYGKINDEDRRQELQARSRREHWTPAQFQNEWLWGLILRHPDGPAEFPMDQITTLRWFEPRNCPVKDIAPKDLFPQLRGHTVRTRRCPHCRRSFVEVDGKGVATSLGNHLRIEHTYDMANILAYGDKIGIDFTGVEFTEGEDVEEYSFGEEEPEAVADNACPECGAVFEGQMAAARLAKHIKTHEAVPV